MSKFTNIFLLAFLYWFIENNFFGWNMFPQSEAELIADGIVMLILAIAVTVQGK
jgi:hypothetical protein